MSETQQNSFNKIVDIDNYHKMEIEEIFTSLRTANSLRVQVYSFFGTANLTILGFALGGNSAGLILIAASVIGLLTLVDRRIRNYQYLLLARGLELENTYALDKETAFVHSYAARSSYYSKSRIKKYSLPLFIFIIEIAMAILSWALLNWVWF